MNTPRKHFDEMLLGANDVRAPYSAYDKWFAAQDPARLTKKSKEAEAFFRRTGITFNVYGQAAAQERLIPFDLIPRIIANREWTKLSKGEADDAYFQEISESWGDALRTALMQLPSYTRS